MDGSKKLFSPDNISFGLVLALAFLLPVFFLTVPGLSLDVSKALLVSVLTLASLALWFVGRLIDGAVRIPRSLILLCSFVVAIVFLISSLVSPASQVSLFGQGPEVGTFAFILIGALLALTSALTLDSRNKIFWTYSAILASFGLVAIWHVIRLFAGPATLSFGIFTGEISNMVGKWNDMATFAGLIAVLSLATLELLSLSRLYKIVLYIILALSLLLLSLVNFSFAWAILAVVSIILFVYAIYLNRFDLPSQSGGVPSQGRFSNVPGVALFVFLVSLFFFFTANSMGGAVANKFKTTQVEVRPSWSATYEVAKQSISYSAQNAVLGIGPNRFVNAWTMYKPAVLNNTVFWSTDFNAGIGLIPTFAVTVGLLGLLAWVLLFATFLYRGVKSVLAFGIGRISQYLVISSFLSALYLWLFSIFYVPSIVVMSLSFLFTGLFVAVLASEKLGRTVEFSLLSNPKIGFVSVLVLIFMIVASAAFGYVFVSKAVSATYFQKAVTAINGAGGVDTAELNLNKAVSLNPADVYYRGLSQIALIRLNTLLQQKDITPDNARTQFTNLMGNAVNSAKLALDYDGTNYVNWMNIGGIYEAVVPLGINGAYEEAVKSYQAALVSAPTNPLIHYTMARLEVGNKDTKAARESLNKALALKNDYTDALFFLSQIEASEGNVSEAIARADQASLISPNDVGLFFQLGLLKYTAKDYEGAIVALERATSLTTDYANAMYFLGLSYDKVGRKADALSEFNRIGQLNPDNQEVKNIVSNLTAGKSALTDVPPPAPEKKKAPPIDETAKSTSDL